MMCPQPRNTKGCWQHQRFRKAWTEEILTKKLQREHGQHLHFRLQNLQHFSRLNPCYFKLLSLWYFVIATQRNECKSLDLSDLCYHPSMDQLNHIFYKQSICIIWEKSTKSIWFSDDLGVWLDCVLLL